MLNENEKKMLEWHDQYLFFMDSVIKAMKAVLIKKGLCTEEELNRLASAFQKKLLNEVKNEGQINRGKAGL